MWPDTTIPFLALMVLNGVPFKNETQKINKNDKKELRLLNKLGIRTTYS